MSKNGIRNSKGKDGRNTSKLVSQSYFYLCITGGTLSSFKIYVKTVTNKEGLWREYNNSKYFSRNPTAPSWGYLEVLRASDLNILSFYYRCVSLKGFWAFSPPPFLLKDREPRQKLAEQRDSSFCELFVNWRQNMPPVCLFFLFLSFLLLSYFVSFTCTLKYNPHSELVAKNWNWKGRPWREDKPLGAGWSTESNWPN